MVGKWVPATAGPGWEGLMQVHVCATLLGARHVPERLCGDSLFGGYNKCSSYFFTFKTSSKLLLINNMKLHTSFRYVLKSTTLDDLKRPLRTLFLNTCIFGARHENLNCCGIARLFSNNTALFLADRILTANAVWSAIVIILSSVRPSVRPSVCDEQLLWLNDTSYYSKSV